MADAAIPFAALTKKSRPVRNAQRSDGIQQSDAALHLRKSQIVPRQGLRGRDLVTSSLLTVDGRRIEVDGYGAVGIDRDMRDLVNQVVVA